MPHFTTPTSTALRQTVTGCIPVKKHLLQYVIWRERLPDAGTPIPVPGLGPIAAALDMVLTFDHIYLDSAPSPVVDKFTGRLYYAVESTDRQFVPDTGALMFNRFLEQLLRDDLNARILEGKTLGIQEKNVIERFLSETGLDEYLDFESVKKAQWRLRVHRRAPLIRVGRLPSGPLPMRTGARVQRAFAQGAIHW